ncbi:MAG: lactate utilization protein [Bacteroidales bacterium]|nr:lactate utilization protein [Bacteroidales bacterium]
MHDNYHKFIRDSEKIAFDQEHRSKIAYNMFRYEEAVEKGYEVFCDHDTAKKRAAVVRQRVINNLEKYLVEFAAHFEKNGGKIIWAQDAEEAVREITNLVKKHKSASLVKSKSITTEEIGLNEALEKLKVDVVETDLGEFIVQLAGEKPYHIVTPAMHKSRDDVAELYHRKFGIPRESSPEEITSFTRELLRKHFTGADIGITGANFLISGTGSVCITENEGNALMSVSFPRIHIIVAGIDKIIPSLADLDLFWPLLATSGTGQHVTVFNSVFSGPRREEEQDGPEEMVLVLLDNGRTELLARKEQRKALACIRCGACLNACPVYRNIGGYSYGTIYSGPIGSVISPVMKGMSDYKHLSFASSLCGRCTAVCPVMIPLHELLLCNRNESVRIRQTSFQERMAMKGIRFILTSRKRLDFIGASTKNRIMRRFAGKMWGHRRELPVFAEKTFRELWTERRGSGEEE